MRKCTECDGNTTANGIPNDEPYCEVCEGTGIYHYWSDIEDEFQTMVKDWDLTKEDVQSLIENTNFKVESLKDKVIEIGIKHINNL